jgi:LacI family sucrose operon transcriptional repressor
VVKKKITLAQVAELAGVSKSTVSFVLNGHVEKHRIAPETAERVMAVVEEYNYAPSLYARALKSKRTYTIGLIIPDLANIGFATIAKELEKLCRANGYQTLIASSEDDTEKEIQAVNSLMARQVDLLMIASSMLDDNFYLKINNTIPVILFDRRIRGTTLPYVVTCAESATEDVVRRLLDDTVSECFYFGGGAELSPGQERLAGYQQALIKAGIGPNPSWIFHRDYQPDSGYLMMKECVDHLGRFPQALFTASYSILEGVLRYLTEQGALSSATRLATFDNYSILDCLPVAVNSAEQDYKAMSTHLFDCMQSLLDKKALLEPQKEFPARLHFRRRSGK